MKNDIFARAARARSARAGWGVGLRRLMGFSEEGAYEGRSRIPCFRLKAPARHANDGAPRPPTGRSRRALPTTRCVSPRLINRAASFRRHPQIGASVPDNVPKHCERFLEMRESTIATKQKWAPNKIQGVRKKIFWIMGFLERKQGKSFPMERFLSNGFPWMCSGNTVF